MLVPCLLFIIKSPFIVGDDWEHEEIFTDDDEAVGNNPEEREDLEPEIPAPPEIKQVCCTNVSQLVNFYIMRYVALCIFKYAFY